MALIRNICILSLFSGLWGTPVISEAQDAANVLEKTIKGMQKFSDSFVNQPCWLVKYSTSREGHFLPAGYISDQPGSDFVIAQKGELLYSYRKMQTTPPTETWVCWRDGVSTKRTDDSYYELFPDLHPGIFSTFIYVHNIFVDTHKNQRFKNKGIASSFGSASVSESMWFALPRCIERKKDEWGVDPDQDKIDGFSCLVLKRKLKDKVHLRDVIWVDPNHGYITRKRIYYDDDSGQPLMEWKNEDIRKVKPDVWLPFQQSHKMYNNKLSAPKIRGKLRYIRKAVVDDISFEILSDDFFKAPFLKEGMVSDYVQSKAFNVHPDMKEPEKAMQHAITDSIEFTRNSNFKASSKSLLSSTLLILNVLLILGIIGIIQIRILLKKRANNQKRP